MKKCHTLNFFAVHKLNSRQNVFEFPAAVFNAFLSSSSCKDVYNLFESDNA